MIKVALFGYNNTSWMGGVNYLNNLIFAVNSLEDKKISLHLFVGTNADEEMLQIFSKSVKIVQSPFLNNNNFLTFLSKGLYRLTGNMYFINRLLIKNQIDVSFNIFMVGRNLPFKTIVWIPDFQYLHLPELFEKSRIKSASYHIKKQIAYSDRIMLSSESAKKDLVQNFQFDEDKLLKIKVIHFVSQTNSSFFEMSTDSSRMEKIAFYGLNEKFFYLPNQFWKHKNHKVVFQAIRILKSKNIDIELVCTGSLQDNRNGTYIDELQGFIADNQLQNNIKLLGIVAYEDVLFFMRNCISVLNPSLFEGWSTSVEECKSIGKSIILSDIPVHREQNPEDARFFNPENASELADILQDAWNKPASKVVNSVMEKAQENLNFRTLEYGANFQNLVLDLF